MRPTIIIVDDDEADRYLVRRAVKTLGDQVRFVEFEAGDHFLAALEESKSGEGAVPLRGDPVLILLDINMPRMTGFEVLDALRECLGENENPVVVTMYSSSSYGADQADALRYSFVKEYVVKPISAEVLSDLLARHCEKS